MFVLDSDKPFFVMPVCYHPTTVLAVDDERQFLDALKLKVSDHLSLMCFDNPEDALEYIKCSRELQGVLCRKVRNFPAHPYNPLPV